ncbi:MFS transporter [Actinophytocola algeriensis]|uniref:Putative MFS family arabinose efflux permease n=1 Tax=Actinophytocola algeriensis TaxID=1768010 RepID=A0A7W7VF75_9PSEU|nr:MFS transporter [Actinophytocola algeriensis]MBB4907874.1 putative MFS family arabinose efflux permease [Actinophytocola algeriensis]MBE1479904.1 putative MFS family arabinose efflux permease [Actinophytocola algeriensis]
MSPLTRRLLPLHAGVALQGFVLWYPVEKLFMTEIGFDAASVGVMAAAYAAVVPLFEVPSGVLADRWSRRGVLVVASVALAVCSLVGGLSTNVPTYIAGVLALGLYFAMYSGTLDAIVYDTVLEETGGSGDFERRLGRVRFVESVALVGSSLAGGVLAGLLDARATYFVTIPFSLVSIACYLRFREPTLHRAEVRTPLRAHLATTFRAAHRRLVPVIALAVLAAVLTQVVFEFGPLWLVALGVPAVLYGPYWAGLMSTLGIGGLLVGQLARPSRLAGAGVVLTGALVVLGVSHDFVVVTAAQVVAALVLVAVGIHASRLVNDAIPSTVRAGVTSGVSSLSWLVFLPFSLLFGVVSDASGVHRAAWLLVGVAAAVALLLVALRRVAPAAEGGGDDEGDADGERDREHHREPAAVDQ